MLLGMSQYQNFDFDTIQNIEIDQILRYRLDIYNLFSLLTVDN